MSPIVIAQDDLDLDGLGLFSPKDFDEKLYEDISSCSDFESEGSLTEGEMCFGCGGPITDRYLLKVSGRAWHAECLRCCECHINLDRHSSCFIRGENIYCKNDYNREFSTKCAKCLRAIQPTDWVRRAKQNVYHLACFACDSCKRQLSTGEEFALQDDKVLCKAHYIEIIEGGPNSDDSCSQKQKTKRVRTTFSEEQVQILQANFQLDSNPDGQDLERIAQITGLSKRVTQVWFQNSRARQKKHQQSHQNKVNNGDVTMISQQESPTSGHLLSQQNMAAINNHFNNAMHEELNLGPLSVSLTSCSSGVTPSSPDTAETSWLTNPMTPGSEPSLTFMS